MKTKILIVMGLCAAIGFTSTQPVVAQAHPEHKEAHENIKVLDSVDGILKEIHMHQKELADTVKANKLAEVHGHAFAIRDLAKALPAKANPDHKKMVENAVKRVSQLAEDLDKSGDAGDQAKTKANLKKMDAALKTLEEHATM
ncbi:MAG: cecA [Pedosphaera sp.]|nr:cecA [Pedosphaera sp.]